MSNPLSTLTQFSIFFHFNTLTSHLCERSKIVPKLVLNAQRSLMQLSFQTFEQKVNISLIERKTCKRCLILNNTRQWLSETTSCP